MSMHLVQRLTRISLGYIAGCFGAGVTLVAAYYAIAATGGALRGTFRMELVPLLVILVSVWGGLFAAVPSAVAIALAERRRIRSAAIYAGMGAVVGSVAYLLYLAAASAFDPATAVEAFMPLTQPAVGLTAAAMFGGAGLVGGLVYHRIAGRDAGWKQPPFGEHLTGGAR